MPPHSLPLTDRRALTDLFTVVVAATVAIACVIRIYILARGNFYGDDLLLIGRAGSANGWTYIFDNHDGHLMPGAFAVIAALTEVAPLNWMWAAVVLFIGFALATAAVIRMVVIIAGRTTSAAIIIGLVVISPLTVPAFAWLAAGLNSLPMQAAMAWIIGDAVLLARGRIGARRAAISSGVTFAVSLLFFEKAVLIFPAAIAIGVICARYGTTERAASPHSARAMVRHIQTLVITLLAIAVLWAIGYAFAFRNGVSDNSWHRTWSIVWHGVNDALVPALIGGPWQWMRFNPAPPFAAAPTALIVIGWVVVCAVVGAALLYRRGAFAILAVALVYIVVSQGVVGWSRAGNFTAPEIAQTLRYLPDTAVLLGACAAAVVSAPARRVAAGALARIAIPVGAAAIAISALVTAVTFTQRWADNPTGNYVKVAKASLAKAPRSPMLAQQLPLEITTPVSYPANLTSSVFSGLDNRPPFGSSSDRITLLTPTGDITSGGVTNARGFFAGRGTCKNPEIDRPTDILLSGELLRWTWVAAIPYCATSNGDVDVRIGNSASVRARVSSGLHMLYVQVTGAGNSISIAPATAGLAIHTAAGRVGVLTYDH